MGKKVLIIFSVVFLLLQLHAPSGHALLKVTDIRYWSAPDHTRIVIDSDQPVSYKTLELKKPLRLVVNVKEA